MSVTQLESCNCHEQNEHVFTVNSELPCVYDQIIATWDDGNKTMVRDYYLQGVLMFDVVTSYVDIGTADEFYVEGNKLIS